MYVLIHIFEQCFLRKETIQINQVGLKKNFRKKKKVKHITLDTSNA